MPGTQALNSENEPMRHATSTFLSEGSVLKVAGKWLSDLTGCRSMGGSLKYLTVPSSDLLCSTVPGEKQTDTHSPQTGNPQQTKAQMPSKSNLVKPISSIGVT